MEKNRKKEKKTSIGLVILLALVLVGGGLVAIAWWPPTEKIGPSEKCSLLPPGERDACCAQVMAGEPHVMCVGRWVWRDGGCYFDCSATGMPNPASKKCLEDEGVLKIVTEPGGGQVGYCFFPDGSVCEEWAYYRGECHQGDCSFYCGAIGSRSEGWYDCNGNLLFWDNCRSKTLPE